MNVDKLTRACYMNALVIWMKSVAPYAIEGYLTLCSIWAAYVLATPPTNFSAFPRAFALVAQIESDETWWATFIGMAALFHLIGGVFLPFRRLQTISLMMRVVALGMSWMFWTVMGTSTVIGNPDSLYGAPAIGIGFLAFWILVQFPKIPGES